MSESVMIGCVDVSYDRVMTYMAGIRREGMSILGQEDWNYDSVMTGSGQGQDRGR